MRIPIITIGNSRGIRIPKAVLDQVGFTEEVILSVDKLKLVLSPVASVRKGWAKAFLGMAESGDDVLLETPIPDWDEEEWQWE